MTRVRIPSPLRSYTADQGVVMAEGGTVSEILSHLERMHAGIRFRMIDEQERIRQHIRFFLDERAVTDLASPVREGEEFTIICAISGG